jgi:hypothetical protein
MFLEEPMETEWISIEQTMEILGMGRMPVNRLAREGKLRARIEEDKKGRGRHAWEFDRQSVEERATRMIRTPPPEVGDEWMPIAEAMKALKMTRSAVKRRMKMGLLEGTHFGPPEAEALYLWRSQVEEQVRERPNFARQSEWPAVPASELEAAWCAGFFDGEGCVVISLTGGTSHVLQMSLANSHQGAIRKMERVLGGKVYDRPRQKAHYRDQWRWHASGDEAAAVLKRLLPYLIAKAPQAALGIEFQEVTRSKQHGRWGPISPSEWQWRVDQQEKISRLNRPNVPRE